ncbi:MAG: sodium:solute symporter family protein [Verrucomicrobiae bacterium]|nr:sodium:solute symporter family protein [Verrucomicrobiae bacterium]MCX7721433.1 sodium:solute symporter family protein [Verrucomicrobiae bacterium]MDW7980391.1 sodium:solute symporter family protein [Verrucomicrobiales bacterium]
MQQVQLAWVDYAILLAYTAFVIGIGFALRRYMQSSSAFLMAGRTIPAWVTGLAFIAANLGALEVIGMAANGAKYGIMACHFYWVGAIPAMVFLAVFMMPFYYGSKARSVPEYLKLRFDERVRCLNSISFGVMTMMTSGISLHVLADLLRQLLGWDYNLCLWVSAAIVVLYVFKGGLTSAIYTEVLQFFMIVFGFAPVVYLCLKDVGGWGKVTDTLAQVAANPQSLHLANTNFPPEAWTSTWASMSSPQNNPMGMDWFGLTFGLGFVLAFGYWCTNFLVVQRAMAAKDMTAARMTPLIAAVPKMLFPALVILPGMVAVALAYMGKDGFTLPKKPLEPSAYAQLMPIVQEAAAQRAEVAAVYDRLVAAAGMPLDKEKVAALIKDHAEGRLTEHQLKERLQDAVAVNDYNNVMLAMLKRYLPPGLLGLGLTALLASFMSGMAGNVTAFNTIWTYDLYQAYIAPNKSDAHYLWMGRAVTIAGALASIACAYIAKQYGNIMDLVQLVFGFVNAPLFATFLHGMFWARATGHGAFYGLLGGTATSALFHGLTLSQGNEPGIKGAWLTHLLGAQPVHVFQSEMAQNFWLACFAFSVCFVLTLVISLVTKRTKSDEELRGLVYSLTPRITDSGQVWYKRPGLVGIVLLAICAVINIIFW